MLLAAVMALSLNVGRSDAATPSRERATTVAHAAKARTKAAQRTTTRNASQRRPRNRTAGRSKGASATRDKQARRAEELAFGRFVLKDMTQSHEARPAGVPEYYDWYAGPRLSAGNDPGGRTAIVPWGHIYACAEGNPQPNAQVEIRDLRVYLLSKRTRRWTATPPGTAIDGAAFVQDYAGNEHTQIDLRRDRNGGITAGLLPGRNLHFWQGGSRVALNPSDLAAVAVAYRARLVPSSVTATLPSPCVIAGAGADYWPDMTDPDPSRLQDAGIGRFKRLTARWRVVAMTTATWAQLQRSPLPAWPDRRQLW